MPGTGISFLRAYAWVVPFMAMLINLGRQCLFNIPFLYLFNHLWGLTGLLYAQTGADICTTLLALIIGMPVLHGLYATQEQIYSPY